jgi:hypothetical protein
MAERPTLSQRIAVADPSIYMTATHEGTFDKIPGEERPWAHDRWRVTLRVANRTMTIRFRMGLGHQGARPSTHDVLDSLLSEASGVENAVGFEDWAMEYGYPLGTPMKRRQAEGIYNATVRQTERLRRLLGDHQYEVFVRAERD